MNRLAAYFLRGLVVTVPLVLTLYVCWTIFITIDRLLRLPVPGAGFVITLALITLTGFLASNLLTRSLVGAVDRLLGRLPFVRLLYSSTKDLLNAFVGEQRRFDRPVLVALTEEGSAKVVGFVTAESVAHLGLAEHVAVYLPQSYNFAGNLVLFPASRVQPVLHDSAEVMAFIVSGGVSGVKAR